jgi:hypothetical protein
VGQSKIGHEETEGTKRPFKSHSIDYKYRLSRPFSDFDLLYLTVTVTITRVLDCLWTAGQFVSQVFIDVTTLRL